MKNYIDLHMHSKYSEDGEFTVEELVNKCKDAGISIMAIADHNSVKAIEEGKVLAKRHGITYIPAVEIDCTYKGLNFHVVGYGINHKDPEIISIEENIVTQELASSKTKLKLTNELGFSLTKEDMAEFSSSGIYTGEMFADALLSKEEYKDSELLKPYREGGSRSDNPPVNFYWDYYSQGKPCYTEINVPTLEEVIAIVHKNNGICVLAHPGNNLKGRFELFDEMVKLGLDGVEAFSSYHDENTIEYFYNKGKEYNLLITCGSDYHGHTKPSISIGGSRCNIDQKEIEEKLREYKLIN